MQDTYILLNRIIMGNESAYDTLLQNRLTPNHSCDLLQMLRYCVECGEDTNRLDQCYPEALIELAYYVTNIANTSNRAIKTIIETFKTLVKNAATYGNCGALAAILILYSENIFDEQLPAEAIELETPSLGPMDKHQLYLISRKYNYYKTAIDEPNLKRQSEMQEVHYLKEAESKGHRLSKYNLGIYYLKPKADRRGLIKAYGYIKEASELGVARAMLELGNLHDHESTIMPADWLDAYVDDPIAFQSYKQAANLGIPEALFRLAYFYHFIDLPEEVSEDDRIQYAIKYYTGAMDHGGKDMAEQILKLLYENQLSDLRTEAIKKALMHNFVLYTAENSLPPQSPVSQKLAIGFFSSTSSSTLAAIAAQDSHSETDVAAVLPTDAEQKIQKRPLEVPMPDPKRPMMSRI